MNLLKTVIFDWGDTVMRDFPEYEGSMADWPRVEVVPDLPAVLSILVEDYTLALATNAAESNSKQVQAALRRVGLEDYFSFIFTARELGTSKHDPDYYPQVLKTLNCLPEQALMVGDNYETDIAAAKSAGIHTAWFAPVGTLCPQAHPIHDLEIYRMEDLPHAISLPLLPDIPLCLKLLKSQLADQNLEAHSLAVAAAAYRIARMLAQADLKLNTLMVHRGALLHDLDKVSARQQDKAHGQLAAEQLHSLGWPELAEMAERHVVHHILNSQKAPRTWEEKLVYYADKLVDGQRFVGINTRLEILQKRYPDNARQIETAFPSF
jgi:putative nucleotidyltransferase with HDIG domain